MVRSSPRARAGLRRLAASPPPADPPAPMRVWASSMKRIIGVGDAFTSWITDFRRFSNSPLIPAPAWRSPVEGMDGHVSQWGRDVPWNNPVGKAFDHGRLPDSGLSGQDRVVLPPSNEDIRHLPNFEVPAEDGINLPLPGLLCKVDGVKVKGSRSCGRPPGGPASSGLAATGASPSSFEPAVKSGGYGSKSPRRFS